MVIDEIQDQRENAVGEILSASYGFFACIAEGGADVGLKLVRDALGEPSEESNYLIEADFLVGAEAWTGVTRRHPELHHTEIVGDDVQGVPYPSNADST